MQQIKIIIFSFLLFAVTLSAHAALECKQGMPRFRESFEEYLVQAESHFSKMPERNLRNLVLGESREAQELTVLMAPLIPENVPFAPDFRRCWGNMAEFREHLHAEEFSEAAHSLDEWGNCFAVYYHGKVPSLIQEVQRCYQAAKK